MENGTSDFQVADGIVMEPPPPYFSLYDETKRDQLIRPMQEAAKSTKKLDSTIDWITSRKGRNNKEQKSFNKLLQKPYDKNITKKTVEDMISEATAAQKRILERREKGPKAIRLASQFVNFADKFSRFLAAFSGIVEIVKVADEQWGGLAYGTLSVLLIVAYNKKQKEEVIEKELDNLKETFPQFEALKDTYPVQRLEELVAIVYEDVIDFTRMAARYYKRSGTRRTLSAIYDPPKLRIEEKVNRIRHNGAKVLAETNVRLHGRVKEIYEKAQAQIISTKALHTKIDDQGLQIQDQVVRIREQSDLITYLKVQLDKQSNDKARQQLKKMENFLLHDQKDYHERCHDFTNLHGLHNMYLTAEDLQSQKAFWVLDMPRLQQEDLFTKWRHDSKSRFLLLTGQNHREAKKNTSMCWLSPGALALIEHLQCEYPTACITRYVCQIKNLNEAKVPFKDVICGLIFQVLAWNPNILHERYQEYVNKIEAREWKDEDMEVVMKARIGVLAEVLNFFQTSEPFFVIIDRIDNCDTDVHNCLHFLIDLLELVNGEHCILKLFVICDSGYGRLEQHHIKKLRKRGQEFLLTRLEWNQDFDEAERRW